MWRGEIWGTWRILVKPWLVPVSSNQPLVIEYWTKFLNTKTTEIQVFWKYFKTINLQNWPRLKKYFFHNVQPYKIFYFLCYVLLHIFCFLPPPFHFPFLRRLFPKSFMLCNGNIFYLCLCSLVKWMGRIFCLGRAEKLNETKKNEKSVSLKMLAYPFFSASPSSMVSSSDE